MDSRFRMSVLPLVYPIRCYIFTLLKFSPPYFVWLLCLIPPPLFGSNSLPKIIRPVTSTHFPHHWGLEVVNISCDAIIRQKGHILKWYRTFPVSQNFKNTVTFPSWYQTLQIVECRFTHGLLNLIRPDSRSKQPKNRRRLFLRGYRLPSGTFFIIEPRRLKFDMHM